MTKYRALEFECEEASIYPDTKGTVIVSLSKVTINESLANEIMLDLPLDWIIEFLESQKDI